MHVQNKIKRTGQFVTKCISFIGGICGLYHYTWQMLWICCGNRSCVGSY